LDSNVGVSQQQYCGKELAKLRKYQQICPKLQLGYLLRCDLATNNPLTCGSSTLEAK
jgi:hypothetical protein